MVSSVFFKVLSEYLDLNPQVSRLCVAYSGGLDSSVLLHIACQFSKYFSEKSNRELSVLALHLNHGLSENAHSWQSHCQDTCSEYSRLGYNCSFRSEVVEIDKNKNIEEQGRILRYQFFEQYCSEKDVLLTAHHLNDQAETLLFRFFRGSGASSLSGIPIQRKLNNSGVDVLRPFLSVKKKALFDYSRENKIFCVEDESNSDEYYNRNFIRNNLLPSIRKYWPEVDKNLSRSARFFSETQVLLDDLAKIDLQTLLNKDASLLRWGDSLSLKVLNTLSIERQKNVIRYFLKINNTDLPSEKLLLEILRFTANYERENAGEIRWKQKDFSVYLRLFEDCLFFHKLQNTIVDQISFAHQWDFKESATKTFYYKDFYVNSSQLKASASEFIQPILIKAQYSKVDVRFREGGERCQPQGRQHSQSLKKLFQEYRIPTWERDTAPLFYVGDNLIAVADFWVCEGFQGDGKSVENETGNKEVWYLWSSPKYSSVS